MTFEWTKILDWVKPHPSLLFALLLASGFALFGPTSALGMLGLADLVAAWRPWFGVTFVGSGAYLISLSLRWIFTSRKSPVREWWRIFLYKRVLHDLNPQEKKILRDYLADDSVTQYFELQNGVVSGLERKRVLWRASILAAQFTTFPFNIQPWARRYLKRHPELLK